MASPTQSCSVSQATLLAANAADSSALAGYARQFEKVKLPPSMAAQTFRLGFQRKVAPYIQIGFGITEAGGTRQTLITVL